MVKFLDRAYNWLEGENGDELGDERSPPWSTDWLERTTARSEEIEWKSLQNRSAKKFWTYASREKFNGELDIDETVLDRPVNAPSARLQVSKDEADLKVELKVRYTEDGEFLESKYKFESPDRLGYHLTNFKGWDNTGKRADEAGLSTVLHGNEVVDEAEEFYNKAVEGEL